MEIAFYDKSVTQIFGYFESWSRQHDQEQQITVWTELVMVHI